MAKKKKEKVEVVIPDGMKCYEKTGGGSFRAANRIIKPGQKFWARPELIPSAFKDIIKETAPDKKAVILHTDSPKVEGKQVNKTDEVVPEKFKVEKAKDENGEVIKKGDAALYNVVGEDGKVVNEEPLRKGKAEKLLEDLNA